MKLYSITDNPRAFNRSVVLELAESMLQSGFHPWEPLAVIKCAEEGEGQTPASFMRDVLEGQSNNAVKIGAETLTVDSIIEKLASMPVDKRLVEAGRHRAAAVALLAAFGHEVTPTVIDVTEATNNVALAENAGKMTMARLTAADIIDQGIVLARNGTDVTEGYLQQNGVKRGTAQKVAKAVELVTVHNVPVKTVKTLDKEKLRKLLKDIEQAKTPEEAAALIGKYETNGDNVKPLVKSDFEGLLTTYKGKPVARLLEAILAGSAARFSIEADAMHAAMNADG